MSRRQSISTGKNRGIRYEDKINDILKSKGMQPPTFSPGGATNDPDSVFTFKGVNYPLEIKRDLSADFAQIELRWNKKDKFFFSSRSKNVEFIPFLERNGFLNEINEKWDKTPLKFTVSNIGEKERYQDLDNFPDIFKDIRIESIEEFYNSKHPPIHYIQIGTRGFYYMGEDILPLRVPRLNGKPKLRARVKTRSSSLNRYGFLIAIKLRGVRRSFYDIEEKEGRLFPPL
ncbi:MAG: hypothetical protein ACTSQY_04155 [Candidatus Odinarchaeia archaeon]